MNYMDQVDPVKILEVLSKWLVQHNGILIAELDGFRLLTWNKSYKGKTISEVVQETYGGSDVT